MKKLLQPHIINVSRDKLAMCTPTGVQPMVFKFTPEMIKDMGVVNLQLLSSSLKSFIVTNKIKPSSLVIVLGSSVYFEKDYPGPNMPPSQDLEDFVDTIPFSAASAKLFRSGNGFKQIVINRDLYESLKKSFEDLGFSVLAVVPSFVLGPAEANKEVTAETCRVIYKKMDQIIADSFINLQNSSPSLHQQEQVFIKKYQLPVIIVSILFLIFAAVMIPLTIRQYPKTRRKTSVPIIVKPLSTPVPTVTPKELATPSAEIINSLTVQILNASGIPGQAASLSSRLVSAGFVNIRTGNSNQDVDKTQLVLSPKAATSAGEFITELVSRLYPDVSSEQSSEAKFDVTVIISKNTP